jgi:hypothetical protein
MYKVFYYNLVEKKLCFLESKSNFYPHQLKIYELKNQFTFDLKK